MIKNIYRKPTANITLYDKKLDALPQSSGIRQRCPYSLLLFNAIWEILAKSVKQVKEIKYTDWEGRKNTADDMIVYTENPKQQQQQQTPGTKEQF